MRKRLKRKIAIPQVEQARDVLPDSLNREEITQIIADAIVLAEEHRKEKEQARIEEKQKKAKEKWAKALGIGNSYSDHEWPLLIRDSLRVFIRFNMIKKEDINGVFAVEYFQKFVVGLFFQCLSILAVLPTLLCGGWTVHSICSESQTIGDIFSKLILFVSILLFSAVFRGIFRMAAYEVEELKDRNYLSNLFAAIISFVSVIVAVISVIFACKS